MDKEKQEKVLKFKHCSAEMLKNILQDKIIYCTLLHKEYEIKSKTRTAGIPTLDKKDVKNTIISIPFVSHQKEIVDILDKFDTLVNDFLKGLSCEIELRREQYEYYRERFVGDG